MAMGSIFSMFLGSFELLNHPQTIYKNVVYFGHPIHYGALKANQVTTSHHFSFVPFHFG